MLLCALCRAAFEGNAEALMQQLRQWPRDRWKVKDPQGNTVSSFLRAPYTLHPSCVPPCRPVPPRMTCVEAHALVCGSR